MSTIQLRLERADSTALGYVERLLAAAELPADDVREQPDCFYVGYHGDERVGVGGLEAHEQAGLLRSLIVERDTRGRGFGTALCARLETRAQERGLDQLYLLTTTAADFFGRRGYEVTGRDGTPPAIRATAEFDTLCPASATCMRTELS